MYDRSHRLRSNELIITPCSGEIGEMSFGRSKVSFVLQEMPTFDYKAIAMGENMFKPEHRRYSETLFWILHQNHKTGSTVFFFFLPYGDQAFKIDFYVFRKCEEIAEHTRSIKKLHVINVSHMGDKLTKRCAQVMLDIASWPPKSTLTNWGQVTHIWVGDLIFR